MPLESPGDVLSELQERTCKKRGITKQVFAETAGWHFSTLHRLEKGETPFTGSHLKALVVAGFVKEGDDWCQRFERAIENQIEQDIDADSKTGTPLEITNDEAPGPTRAEDSLHKESEELTPLEIPQYEAVGPAFDEAPPQEPRGCNTRLLIAIILIPVALAVLAIGCYAALMLVQSLQNRSSPETQLLHEGGPQETNQPEVASPSILFEDGFGSTMKPGWQVQQGEWRVANGELTTLSGDREWSVAYIGDSGWTDYAVEFDVDFRQRPWDPLEVYVRVQDDRNKVGVHFLKAGEYPHLFIVQDGETRQLARASTYASERARVRFEVVSDMYSLYVNSTKYFSVTDSTFSSGKVGIAIFCDSSACNTIDSFRVLRLGE